MNLGSDVVRSKSILAVEKSIDEQYAKDTAYISDIYKKGEMSGEEYQARLKYLEKAKITPNYMNVREGGLVDIIDGPSAEAIADGTAFATAGTDGKISSITQLDAMNNNEKVVSVNDEIASHGDGHARLTEFTYNDGSEDDKRRGYIKLVDPTGAMANIASGEKKQQLDAIYAALTNSYGRIAFTAIQESRAEKSMIQSTVGDSFAVTLSGRKPNVLAVQAMLINDYDSSKLTWYTAFLNAYEYYLRGSKLAKYKARVRIVLPDFTTYEGYILDLSSSLVSNDDIVVPISFSMVLCNETLNKAYGQAAGGLDLGKKITTSDSKSTAASSSINSNLSFSDQINDQQYIGSKRNSSILTTLPTDFGERTKGGRVY